MKKYFLILLTACAIQAGYSQTEKGKMFIGGSFNLYGNTHSRLDSSYKYDYDRIGFTIAPNFGYFIADNLATGAFINLGFVKSNQTEDYMNRRTYSSMNNYKSNLLSLGLGGFMRYYINITDKFKFFANGNINYQFQSDKRTYQNNYPTNQTEESNNISINISPNFVYFVTPKLGIETSFGNIYYDYSSSKNKSVSYDNHDNSSDYGVNLSLSSFYLGLNYYF
jgi:hypothetical protein